MTTSTSSASAGRTSCTARSASRSRQSGRHLWVEKPAGRDAADTAAIAEAVRKARGACRRSGSTTATRRRSSWPGSWSPSGRLGTVETVDVRLLADYSAHPDGALSWRFDPEYAGTGVLGDLASHGFDLARHVGGQQAGRITELVADQATFITERPDRSPARCRTSRAAATGRAGRSATRTRSRRCCASRPGRAGYLEASRVAVGEQCTYGIEVRGTRGALAWDFRRMGELRVCLDQDYQDAAWQTMLVRPGRRRAGCLPARRRRRDGLRRPQGDRGPAPGARASAAACRTAPRSRTRVVTAELVDAMVQSFEERRWVSL